MILNDKSIVNSLGARVSLLLLNVFALNTAKDELNALDGAYYFQLTYLFLFVNSVYGSIATHAIRRLSASPSNLWLSELNSLYKKQLIISFIGLILFCGIACLNSSHWSDLPIFLLLLVLIIPISQIGMILMKANFKVANYEGILMLNSSLIFLTIIFVKNISVIGILVLQFISSWLTGFVAILISWKDIMNIVKNRSNIISDSLSDYVVALNGGVLGSISKFGVQLIYSSFYSGALLIDVLYLRRFIELFDTPVGVIFNAKLPNLANFFKNDKFSYQKLKSFLFVGFSLALITAIVIIPSYFYIMNYSLMLKYFIVLICLIGLQRLSSISLVFYSIEYRPIDNIIAKNISLIYAFGFIILIFFKSNIFTLLIFECLTTLFIIYKFYGSTLFGSRSFRF